MSLCFSNTAYLPLSFGFSISLAILLHLLLSVVFMPFSKRLGGPRTFLFASLSCYFSILHIRLYHSSIFLSSVLYFCFIPPLSLPPSVLPLPVFQYYSYHSSLCRSLSLYVILLALFSVIVSVSYVKIVRVRYSKCSI